jgi:hypothetical protein
MSYFWKGHFNENASDFSAEELALNRQGKMSGSQKTRVDQAIKTKLRVNFWGMFFAIIFLVGTGVYFFVNDQVLKTAEGGIKNLVYGTFLFTVLVSILGLIYQTYIKPRIKKVGTVKATSGKAKSSVYNSETVKMYYVEINGIKFAVSPKFQDTFKKDKSYSLYYT